jgi:hypothetical protein
MRRDDSAALLVRNAKGSALVAARDLPAGAVVARLEGKLVPLESVPPEEVRHALWFDTDRWMIPTSPGRHINHSCDPNCELRDCLEDPDACDAVTTRPVAAGEELTFGYDRIDADEYYANLGNPLYRFWHPDWSFDCLCGAPNCRGRIDGYVLVGDIEGARRRHPAGAGYAEPIPGADRSPSARGK